MLTQSIGNFLFGSGCSYFLVCVEVELENQVGMVEEKGATEKGARAPHVLNPSKGGSPAFNGRTVV